MTISTSTLLKAFAVGIVAITLSVSVPVVIGGDKLVLMLQPLAEKVFEHFFHNESRCRKYDQSLEKLTAEIETLKATINKGGFGGAVLSQPTQSETVAPGVWSVGTLFHFISSHCPNGSLALDGRHWPCRDYPVLAEMLGCEKTVFRLPDARGEFLRAWDGGRGVDSGRDVGSAQDADFKSFTMQSTRGATGTQTYGPVNLPKSTAQPYGNLFGGHWADDFHPSGGGGANTLSVMWDKSEVRPRNVAYPLCVVAT